MLVKPLTLIVFLLLISCGLHSQNKSKSAETVDPISYCELFQHRDQYPLGREVRIKATWTHGFEWSYLSFRDCLDQPKAWVEFVDDDKLCGASKTNLNKMTHGFDNKADVTVVGELHDGGGYGHMGVYRYKFIVTCLESYKKIPVGTP